MAISIEATDALIIVDIQNDFMPGGSLAVKNADQIIEGINYLIQIFSEKKGRVILTQDWHHPKHLSFALSYTGKKPFDSISGVKGIGPVLWPDHCVQGTSGAEFYPGERYVPKMACHLLSGEHQTCSYR